MIVSCFQSHSSSALFSSRTQKLLRLVSYILAFPGLCFIFNLDRNRLSVICTTLCYADDQHDSGEMSPVG